MSEFSSNSGVFAQVTPRYGVLAKQAGVGSRLFTRLVNGKRVTCFEISEEEQGN